MDSFDAANLLSGGSRLLSQSPQFSFDSAGSSTHTGPGGDDLSLSELCLDNDDDDSSLPTKKQPQTAAGRHPKTRPSIAQALGFGAPLEDQSDDPSVLDVLQEGEEDARVGVGEDEEGAEGDVTVRVGDEAADGVNRTSIAAQSREEKLQSDLFVLRQLNGTFAAYNDALREAQGGTEVSYSCFYIYRLFRGIFFSILTPLLCHKRLAEQLEQTDALLNKYINILSKSEQVSRLIFDERWMGAEAVRGSSLLSLLLIFETRSLLGKIGRGAARGGGTRAGGGAASRGRRAPTGGTARTGAEGEGGAGTCNAR